MPSTCAACGSRSVCLAVHLLLGRCDGETACSCPEAGDVRKRREKEVDDLYTAHANSYPEEVAEYLTAPPRSLARDGPQVGRHGLRRLQDAYRGRVLPTLASTDWRNGSASS